MPRVPTYGNQKVQQQGLPAARMAYQNIDGADANAFGAIEGRQFQELGKDLGAVNKIVQQQQDDEDAAAVFAKKNQYREGLLEIQDQVRQRQGMNAKGATEWANGEMERLRDKTIGELGNDRQRDLFAQDAESVRISHLESFSGHERQQLEQGHDDEWSASKDLAVRQAQQDPSTAGSVEAEITRANQYQAARKGWAPEVLQAETLKDLTKMHGGILDAMVDNDNLQGAQEYLKQHRDKIDAVAAAALGKKIRSKALDAYSTNVADKLIAEGVSYSAALQMIEKNYKGEDRDKVLSKVRERYGDAERIKREQADELIDEIEKQSYKAGGMGSVSDATIEKLSQFDAGMAQRVREAKAKEQENMANGGNRFAKQTNYSTMEELNKLIESGDITKPEQLDRFAGSLEKGDYEALRKTMNSKSEVDAKAVLIAYKERAGIKSGASLTEKQTAEYSVFLQGVTAYIKDTSRPQDLDTLADKFFIEKSNKNSWFFDKDLPRNAITEDAIGSQERREKGLMNNPDYAKAQEILRGMGKNKAANDPALVMRFMQQNGMTGK